MDVRLSGLCVSFARPGWVLAVEHTGFDHGVLRPLQWVKGHAGMGLLPLGSAVLLWVSRLMRRTAGVSPTCGMTSLRT